MSYKQIYYHIIFSTKWRQPTLKPAKRRLVYSYIWGILKHKKCYLYRIGGIDDHIHLLTALHPTICLSDLIRELKTSTSKWIKENKIYPNFQGWQREYGAFTTSHSHHGSVIDYIKNQVEHHKSESFIDEFKRLLHEEGVPFEERFLQ